MQRASSLTPQVMNNIQVTDLREKAPHRLVVALSVFYCPRPVVRRVVFSATSIIFYVKNTNKQKSENVILQGVLPAVSPFNHGSRLKHMRSVFVKSRHHQLYPFISLTHRRNNMFKKWTQGFGCKQTLTGANSFVKQFETNGCPDDAKDFSKTNLDTSTVV